MDKWKEFFCSERWGRQEYGSFIGSGGAVYRGWNCTGPAFGWTESHWLSEHLHRHRCHTSGGFVATIDMFFKWGWNWNCCAPCNQIRVLSEKYWWIVLKASRVRMFTFYSSLKNKFSRIEAVITRMNAKPSQEGSSSHTPRCYLYIFSGNAYSERAWRFNIKILSNNFNNCMLFRMFMKRDTHYTT